MTKIIQFPRPNPNRKWSPREILAIEEEPGDRLRQRQERSKAEGKASNCNQFWKSTTEAK